MYGKETVNVDDQVFADPEAALLLAYVKGEISKAVYRSRLQEILEQQRLPDQTGG